ncbi:general substrate transporter [Pleurotus eryngii]|uniref:General substrate transporter n=1 Tax=Pleurotus eryngii TaxID=5323 RepID=A0A9P6DIB5_PLEER|nr:general substrate transporter [Pleurotus eryngii]
MSQPTAQEKDAPSADHSSEKAASPDVPKLTHGQETNVLEVVNADYALALSTGPQLSPTSWASIELFGILLVAYMGSLSNGFDGSGMYPNFQGDQTYLDFFGIDGQDAGGGVGTTTAIIFGIYSIGSIAAVMLAGPVTDRFGRRGGMCLGSMIIIIGAIVITAARDASYLLGGRFTLGFGVAITTTAAPAYVVEMSPPQWRGRLTGLYNTFYYTGSILCTGITIATGRTDGTASWRVPLGIQIAPAVILTTMSFVLPESPRWLISQGRNDEARRILAKYHGNGDPNAPLVKLEWREFEEAIKLDASDKRWWDYKELVNTPNARYRTFMMLLMGFFGQWSGNGLGYFLPILFQNAGANSQNQRLTLNFINTVVSAIGALIGTSLADKVGRRRMWFWGTLASAGTLAVTTGCTARFGSSGSDVNGANAAIAFIFLFGFVYSLTYTPLQAIYPAEVLSYNTRAKGMAMYALVVSCASFVNTYPAPIALGRIQWRYYIVYVVWDVLEAIMVYFFAVETKGRTLEELDEIFSDPHPVRASLAKKKVVIVEKDDRKEVVKVLEP